MADQEHVQFFLVGVPVYGDPEMERERAMVSVGRALHHMTKPGCTIRSMRFVTTEEAKEGVPMTPILMGPEMMFDPKGDDMGNHEGHDKPLVPVKPFNAFALEDDCDADD